MESGTEIAGYRVERVLATGGTGTVYLVDNPTLPRLDALKVLSADLTREPGFRERFIREADIAAGLHHPNIVSVYNRGETDDGQLWIAMQYVAGSDAEAALQDGAVAPERAVHIITETAKALDYAHQRGVVHHDIKPANILLSDDDEHVVLTDFGVARALDHTEAAAADATLAATLAYAAPEVIKGDDLGARADVYSLGCTLFRLLTGKQPFFDADGTPALIQAHLTQPPPLASDHMSGGTERLDRVIARALAKDPAARFRTARELAREAAAAMGIDYSGDRVGQKETDTAPRRARTEHAPRVPPPPPPTVQAPWTRSPGGGHHVPITITATPAAERGTSRRVIASAAVLAVVVIVIITVIALLATSSESSADSAASLGSPSPTSTCPNLIPRA